MILHEEKANNVIGESRKTGESQGDRVKRKEIIKSRQNYGETRKKVKKQKEL